MEHHFHEARVHFIHTQHNRSRNYIHCKHEYTSRETTTAITLRSTESKCWEKMQSEEHRWRQSQGLSYKRNIKAHIRGSSRAALTPALCATKTSSCAESASPRSIFSCSSTQRATGLTSTPLNRFSSTASIFPNTRYSKPILGWRGGNTAPFVSCTRRSDAKVLTVALFHGCLQNKNMIRGNESGIIRWDRCQAASGHAKPGYHPCI